MTKNTPAAPAVEPAVAVSEIPAPASVGTLTIEQNTFVVESNDVVEVEAPPVAVESTEIGGFVVETYR